MSDKLATLKAELLSGIRSSMQSSYSRRAPAKLSVPKLLDVRKRLREFVLAQPASAEGWELLSQVEETLLNYREAIQCLRESMSLGTRNKRRMLKRLVLLEQSLKEWSQLALTPEQLFALGEFLTQRGVSDELHGRTLEHTSGWLKKNGLDVLKVLGSFNKRGGFTDFQILNNIVRP